MTLIENLDARIAALRADAGELEKKIEQSVAFRRSLEEDPNSRLTSVGGEGFEVAGAPAHGRKKTAPPVDLADASPPKWEVALGIARALGPRFAVDAFNGALVDQGIAATKRNARSQLGYLLKLKKVRAHGDATYTAAPARAAHKRAKAKPQVQAAGA
jgi:hypothetical protein